MALAQLPACCSLRIGRGPRGLLVRAAGFLLALVILGCSHSRPPMGTPSEEDRTRREELALSRLTDRAESNPRTLDAIQRYRHSSRSLRDRAEFNAAAQDSAVVSRLHVCSNPPGATVKYRLIGLDDVHTASKPTDDTEEVVTIGFYYIWTEVNGVATSPKNNQYTVLEEDSRIEIPQSGS